METASLSPVIVEFDAPLGTAARPHWRGRLHVFAFLAALPLLAAMTVLADGRRARFAVVVYAAGLCSMFLVSATYHRWVHTLHARALWRRADHATIYAAIAGTFTPICLIGAPHGIGPAVLVLMWTGAFIGMSMKILGWRHARIAGGILYIGLGWAGMIVMPQLWQHAGAWPSLLIMIGGAFYTIGAIWFHRQWPKLRPAVFSYHEIWHACTVVAAFAHLAAVWLIVA